MTLLKPMRTLMRLLTALAIVASILAIPTAASASAHTCNGLVATIEGTEGDDVIEGTPGDDVIVGLGGRDNIRGLGGNDTICGGRGRDVIKGNGGDDTLLGGRGGDVIRGGGGDDTLIGENGRDKLFGGRGEDVLEGRARDDRLVGGADADRLDGGGATDDADGGSGVDLCTAETISGCERSQAIELAVLDEINTARANDCDDYAPPVAMRAKTSTMSAHHSWDMAAHNFFSHESPEYGKFAERLQAFGITGAAGENLAAGYATAAAAVDGWLGSTEGHRENLCNPEWTHVGIGVISWNTSWQHWYTTVYTK